jgi:hypothetical protein
METGKDSRNFVYSDGALDLESQKKHISLPLMSCGNCSPISKRMYMMELQNVCRTSKGQNKTEERQRNKINGTGEAVRHNGYVDPADPSVNPRGFSDHCTGSPKGEKREKRNGNRERFQEFRVLPWGSGKP